MTWSPVIMTGLIPAWRQVATATFASGRGGSIIPNIPIKVKSYSSSSGFAVTGSVFNSLYATAITRSACPLISEFIVCAVSKSPLMHREAITSKAPFTMAMYLPPILCTVVMSFRSESKGSSLSLGYCLFKSSFRRLFL